MATDGVQHLDCDPSTGKARVSGADGLKSSEVHPQGCGLAVFDQHDRWVRSQGTAAIEIDSDDSDADLDWDDWQIERRTCAWGEARFDAIAVALRIPADFPLK